MITVHNCETSDDINHDSDNESIEERSQQILLVQETANKEISHPVINDSHESNLAQSKVVNTFQATWCLIVCMQIWREQMKMMFSS